MRTRLISDEDTTTSHFKGLELATIRKGGVVEWLSANEHLSHWSAFSAEPPP